MTSFSASKLGRRAALAGLLAAAVAGRAAAADNAAQAVWSLYKARFVAADGRVIDNDNHGVSHSEGQGYGLTLAEHFNDPVTFQRILDWTCRNMGRAGDALHAWRYVPNVPVPVGDKNNATDGDLFIAYALSRAGRRWNRPDFKALASDIATDILRLLVRRVVGRTLLMPGLDGFDTGESVTVNPSYYAMFAFEELNGVAPSTWWAELTRDGLGLLRDARFGRWKLPPDWLCVDKSDGGMAPAANKPARFSWDAVRVPLYLAWSGYGGCEAARSIAEFWAASASGRMPAWIDLVTGQTAPYAASPGLVAVRDFALGAAHKAVPETQGRAALPVNYYAASLMLLADVGRARVSELPNRPVLGEPPVPMPMASSMPGGRART